MTQSAQPAPQGKAPKGAQVEGQAVEEVMEEEHHAGMPAWLETAFPWMVSVTFHLGIFLVGAFVLFMANQAAQDDREAIVLPTSFADESNMPQVAHPGIDGDPNRDARQNLKEMVKDAGWAQTESTENLSSLLAGSEAENDAALIAVGTGGSVGKGQGGVGKGAGGVLAPYGTPGGGRGIGVKFFNSRASAKKIVYILDHSGSMLDTFDFLREEAKKSVREMNPSQWFSCVMVSETASPIFPTLQRASPDVKAQFATKLGDYRAQGYNNDLLPPFRDAFQKAFEMQPEVIYFLTDGRSDPKLIDEVAKLNKNKKVHVNTIGYLTAGDPDAEDQLKRIAKENGGLFKSVTENDLGK